MAEAASTSDRMLMHYFKDKDEILTLALNRISQEMFHLLNNGSRPMLDFEELVSLLIESIKNNQFKPYLDIWFELVHLASDGKEPYSTISKDIGKTYWNWLLSSYKPKPNEDLEQMASLIFAFIEGGVLLYKMGMDNHVDMAMEGLLKLYQRNENSTLIK